MILGFNYILKTIKSTNSYETIAENDAIKSTLYICIFELVLEPTVN